MERRQQSWPRKWLMTDERMGGRLWTAVERLPKDAGIVLRHHSLERTERARLAGEVSRIAREAGILLAVAADRELAEQVGADLVHNPEKPAPGLPFSRSVHSAGEAHEANQQGAVLVFVSPVFSTRSHPGRRPLGPELAQAIARAAEAPAIALGGMNEERFAALEGDDFYGWAAIDAWL